MAGDYDVTKQDLIQGRLNQCVVDLKTYHIAEHENGQSGILGISGKDKNERLVMGLKHNA
jgi:hypothetical protein